MTDLYALAVLLMISRNPAQSADQPDEQLTRRVLTEYPKAVGILQDRLSCVRGLGRTTDESNAGEPEHSIVAEGVSFARNQDSRRFTRTYFRENPPVERVRVWSSKCEFLLLREKKDGPLIVRGFDAAPQKKNSDFDSSWDLTVGESLVAPYSVFGWSMAEAMAEPTFKILAVTKVDRGGKELLKIEFDVRKERGIQNGWVLTSPEDAWVTVEWDVTIGTRGRRMSGRVEYDKRQLGIPVPKHVIAVDAPKFMETAQFKRSFDFEEIHLGPVPEKEFTLGAFGLPDLTATPRLSGGNTGYWFLGMALVLLAAAVALKQYGSRTQRG